MGKYIYSLAFFLFLYFVAYSQIKANELYDFETWPTMGTPVISNNGHFVGYTVRDNKSKADTLIVHSTISDWKMKVLNVGSGQFCFTENNQKLLFLKGNGNLVIYDLRKKTSTELANVGSFKTFTEGIKRWLIYWLKDPGTTVVVINLQNGKRHDFFNTTKVLVNKQQNELLISSAEGATSLLEQFHLETGVKKVIWRGAKIRNIVTDENLRQICFEELTSISGEEISKVLYWSDGENSVDSLQITELPSSFKLNRIERFSQDGSRIFFQATKQNADTLKDQNAASVDVWNFKDDKIQSEQLLGAKDNRSYGFVYDLNLKTVFAIEDEEYSAWPVNDEFAILQSTLNNRRDIYLISTRTGKRHQIEGLSKSTIYSEFPFWISPSLNFVVYFNPEVQEYFSYNVKSGETLNITASINESWTRYFSKQVRGIAGWVKGRETLLLYGKYDLWKIDLSGVTDAICLTNNYGIKNRIVFSLNVNRDRETKSVDFSTAIVLTAFNPENKRNGFYRVTDNSRKNPELLTLDDCIYDLNECATTGYIGERIPFTPVKALNANFYVVRKESTNDFGNYFVTRDFRNFKALSNIHPEANLNWYKTSLHTWKSLKGNQVQGVLYMPSDFDSSKKYPVIFYYYNWMSDGLNAYIKPNYLEVGCYINVPLYTSRGYLVAAVDKLNETEITGEDIVSSVVSSAKYFSKKPYIDSMHMGLNGYSHGGYETYQLITESKLFAAAISGGGYSDLISGSGALSSRDSWSAHNTIVVEAGGHTLWERPDIYIKNSPVVNANQISTPLLIMHNKLDGAVDFSQGIEMFSSLRSLGKPVWLLQYDGEDHGIFFDLRNVKDYSARQMQFFDHYLKGQPAPIWMTQGIPAKEKGIKRGLALDPTGKCSETCPVCNPSPTKEKQNSTGLN